MEKIKLGILGIGNMGSAHSKNILEGKCPKVELYAVCDVKAEKIAWIKEEHPEVKCFDNAEEMTGADLKKVLIEKFGL